MSRSPQAGSQLPRWTEHRNGKDVQWRHSTSTLEADLQHYEQPAQLEHPERSQRKDVYERFVVRDGNQVVVRDTVRAPGNHDAVVEAAREWLREHAADGSLDPVTATVDLGAEVARRCD